MLISVPNVVLVTGVSPNSIGTETVRVLAPYAKTIIAASRSIARYAPRQFPTYIST